MKTDLQEKGVLITGASGGIGLAAARAFAAEGSMLALHYHTNDEPLKQLRHELESPAVVVQADLRDESQAEQMFADTLLALPKLDVLVVNAGIWNRSEVPLHKMNVEQWRETLTADLTSAFLSCRAFLRHLADSPRESAAIVLVASTAAVFGEANHADYSSAKAAMAYGLNLSLKNEIVRLAPRGRVNCVCPGWTDTPMAAGMIDDASLVARATATMPLRKVAQAEDIANAIVFLASEKLAGHLSGSILTVAGGMEGRLLHSPGLD